MLLANCAVGAATPATGVLVVAASGSGAVDVANLTPFGAANSD